MVIGILESVLNHVVIDVGQRQLRPDAIYVQCFELEESHRACSVLCQSLVYPDGYPFTRNRSALYKMLVYELFCSREAHLDLSVYSAAVGT